MANSEEGSSVDPWPLTQSNFSTDLDTPQSSQDSNPSHPTTRAIKQDTDSSKTSWSSKLWNASRTIWSPLKTAFLKALFPATGSDFRSDTGRNNFVTDEKDRCADAKRNEEPRSLAQQTHLVSEQTFCSESVHLSSKVCRESLTKQGGASGSELVSSAEDFEFSSGFAVKRCSDSFALKSSSTVRSGADVFGAKEGKDRSDFQNKLLMNQNQNQDRNGHRPQKVENNTDTERKSLNNGVSEVLLPSKHCHSEHEKSASVTKSLTTRANLCPGKLSHSPDSPEFRQGASQISSSAVDHTLSTQPSTTSDCGLKSSGYQSSTTVQIVTKQTDTSSLAKYDHVSSADLDKNLASGLSTDKNMIMNKTPVPITQPTSMNQTSAAGEHDHKKPGLSTEVSKGTVSGLTSKENTHQYSHSLIVNNTNVNCGLDVHSTTGAASGPIAEVTVSSAANLAPKEETQKEATNLRRVNPPSRDNVQGTTIDCSTSPTPSASPWDLNSLSLLHSQQEPHADSNPPPTHFSTVRGGIGTSQVRATRGTSRDPLRPSPRGSGRGEGGGDGGGGGSGGGGRASRWFSAARLPPNHNVDLSPTLHQFDPTISREFLILRDF